MSNTVFRQEDLPMLSPFRLDSSGDVRKEERVAKSGAPYNVVVVKIRPVKRLDEEPCEVEVFESTYRRMQALTYLAPDAAIAAIEKDRQGSNFKDIILSNTNAAIKPK